MRRPTSDTEAADRDDGPGETKADLTAAHSLDEFIVRGQYLRRHPCFDAAERQPRLELAAVARRVLETLNGEEAPATGLARLRDFLSRPEWAPHIAPASIAGTLLDWAASDERSLGEALGAFTAGGDAVQRFERFAKAAIEARVRAPDIDRRRHTLLTVGSLFNFALEPDAFPMVRSGPFHKLEERLHQEPKRGATAVEQYKDHLGFAEWITRAMREAGLPVRDMIDVQALIFSPIAGDQFWSLPRPSWDSEAAKGGGDLEAGGPRRNTHYLALSACLGYEAPYLREWIEFHRLVGVERFFLYNNGDRHGQREVLEPYISEGIVVLHDWPRFPPQVSAMEHCLERHGAEARWIAFIDDDEFLFSPTLARLPEVLTQYEPWPAVGVAQAGFGPSGHRKKPRGLVVESYTKSLPSPYIRSIVDPARVSAVLSPHFLSYRRGAAVDENFYPVWVSLTPFPSFSKLRINHYYTKSEEEFRAKWARRRPDTGAPRASAAFDEVLAQFELRGNEDRSILRYVPTLHAAIERSSKNGISHP